jgi:hypothetical protein
MERAQAEAAIRLLCRQWRSAERKHIANPAFSDFLRWVRFKGYGHYLSFDSQGGELRQVRLWFEGELIRLLRDEVKKSDDAEE